MKLTLTRRASQGHCTIGRLHIDGAFACATLEDLVREVEAMPVDTWKVHGETAIPVGTYRVTLENSPRFGAETLTLHDVPGFEYIRMHAGNTSDDTEGCILLGMQATETSLIGGTSRPAVALVKDEVRKAIKRGESVTITVSSAA